MSADEINRGLAEAAGWVYEWHDESRPGKCDGRLALPHWHRPDGVESHLPDFTSPDDSRALRAIQQPLLDAGWRFSLEWNGVRWRARWRSMTSTSPGHNTDRTYAESEATLAALRAIRKDDGVQGAGRTASAREQLIANLLAECDDWLEGRRSWCNLGPSPPYTPDVIARMDAAEIDKRAAMIRALIEVGAMPEQDDTEALG